MQEIRIAVAVICLGFVGLAGAFVNYSAPPSARLDHRRENQQNMSHAISNLLIRNLQDVFGENDAARRRKAIAETFTEDAVFYEPNGGVYRGRAEIDGIAGKLRTLHPDFRYHPLGDSEEVGNAGRVRWTEGRPGEAPEVAGTDFIIVRDGRIAAIYLFFDKLP